MKLRWNKANLRDLIAATGLVFLLKIGPKSLIFGPMWPGNLMEDLKKAMSSFVHHFKAIGEFKLKWQSGKNSIWVKIADFLVSCDLKIWRMTLKNNRAHLLCYFKLCASFYSHPSIQNGVTVWKRQIWVKIGNFLSRVTSKFDEWPWKPMGHLLYATSSFVFHFIAICEIKMKLQSGNTKFRSKSANFCPEWPWNLIDDLKNNRAPLLCYCKLSALFHSHLWIQNGSYSAETLNLGQNWGFFCPMWPW